MALALLMAGCGGAGTVSTPAAPPVPSADVAPADASGLCAALEAARGGDLLAARARFDHSPLHDLATTLLATDRAVAARLLEAKARVEADLAPGSATAGQASAHLAALAVAARSGHEALGERHPFPCVEGAG